MMIQPLGGISGFGLFKSLSSNNVQVIRNDGNATQELDTTAFAVDTDERHVKIEIDPVGNKGIIQIGTNSPIEFEDTTNRIPGTDTTMFFVFASDESGGNNDVNIHVFNIKTSYIIP